MNFLRKNIAAMAGYVPGFQPSDSESWIKLNTNENPYPPSPAVVDAVCINSGIEIGALQQFASVSEATEQALRDCAENDRVIVCGSFYTVAEAMRQQLY